MIPLLEKMKCTPFFQGTRSTDLLDDVMRDAADDEVRDDDVSDWFMLLFACASQLIFPSDYLLISISAQPREVGEQDER